jgi:hypothetical protein
VLLVNKAFKHEILEMQRYCWQLFKIRNSLLRNCVMSFVRMFEESCVISGFRCYVDEICDLLGYHAASNGNPLPLPSLLPLPFAAA